MEDDQDPVYDTIPATTLERRALIRWLKAHPVWNHPEHGLNNFSALAWIDLAYVNPEDDIISDNGALNVKPQVWIEAGPYIDCAEWVKAGGYQPSHDIRLDCGGDTLEEALCELAVRVRYHYGNYNED